MSERLIFHPLELTPQDIAFLELQKKFLGITCNKNNKLRKGKMTIYTIGYISGHSYTGSEQEAWQALVDCVEKLRRDPERIVAEARRLDAPEKCENGCCTLHDMAKAYQGNDATLIIYDEEPNKKAIQQFASGDRELKEHVRRAFCRLVIEDMHRLGIEVNLKVS